MKVLGVDPGLSETGWAVLESDDGAAGGPRAAAGGEAPRPGGASRLSPRLAASGLIKTGPSMPLADRLRRIHETLGRVLAEHRPAALAIEEMFFLVAAHTVRASLQARGVILLAAAQARTPVSEYNPRKVKSALTGSGAAVKAQMQRMVARTLGLAETLRPDDVSDAAAIALCHLRSTRSKGARVLERIGGAA